MTAIAVPTAVADARPRVSAAADGRPRAAVADARVSVVKSVHEGKPFFDVIQGDPEMKRIFSPEQLTHLLNPSAHTGSASEVVDGVLAALRK